MEIKARQTLNLFFEELGKAKRRVLLCDYDGTLAPFRVNRDEAVPYPRVLELLDNIQAVGTRLALITGRSTEELRALLDLKSVPEIWGSHGRERLFTDGRLERFRLSDSLKAGLKTARYKLEHADLANRVETKYGCLAVHWRGLKHTEIDVIRRTTEELLKSVAQNSGLVIHQFDGGIELRAPGRNKGTAVRDIVNEESPAAVFAFLGDDITDEDAFKALDSRGMTVLVRDEPRTSAAKVRIRPPDELITFLARWLEVTR